MLQAVVQLFEFVFVFARQDYEAAGEAVAEGVEGDGLLPSGVFAPVRELGVGAVGGELGGGSGRTGAWKRLPAGAARKRLRLRRRQEAGSAMDAFAGGVGLGDEFGGEFLVDFRVRRIVEEREVAMGRVSAACRRHGGFFGFASEFSGLVLLRAADGSRCHVLGS